MKDLKTRGSAWELKEANSTREDERREYTCTLAVDPIGTRTAS